jgi:polysaccharide pyruvyl transferase WcaK-like protein
VVFVPLQRPDDAEAAIEVIRRCKSAPTLLGGGYDLRTMSALFARCTAIVSMRLHALILAARLGVPFAGIAYDPKVGALLETLAYPLPALERGVDADALADRLWREHGALKAHLAETTPAAAQRAAAGFDRLARLAEGAVAEALKQ